MPEAQWIDLGMWLTGDPRPWVSKLLWLAAIAAVFVIAGWIARAITRSEQAERDRDE